MTPNGYALDTDHLIERRAARFRRVFRRRALDGIVFAAPIWAAVVGFFLWAFP